MRNNLNEIVIEIREILEKKRQELELRFVEKSHTYYLKDENGKVRKDYPSVSKVLKNFYIPFDAGKKALEMSNGDVTKQKVLLNEWKMAGDLSTNMGSRVHYELEKHLINEEGKYKKLRKPIFECNDEQIIKSDNMISAGKNFLKLMKERGAVSLDTEINLGSNELKYVGQCDNGWLILNKYNDLSLLITDYKSNQPKNFEVKPYNGYLLKPFDKYRDYALSHYFIQIPLYGKLLINMLKGSKYENITMSGGIVVLLKDDGSFIEYRVPNDIKETVLNLNISDYIK